MIKKNNWKPRWKSVAGKGRYIGWRKLVFEQNKRFKGSGKFYICEHCGKRLKTTRAMHAHHIFSWSKYPNRRYTARNGVVFCIKCHKIFHKKYGYDSVTNPSLILEYIKENDKIRKYIGE